MYDGVVGEVRLIEDDRLEFRDETKTVQVNGDLYVFKLEMCKITNFASSTHLVETILSPHQSIDLLHQFAVTYTAGNIVLTGGKDGNLVRAQTYLMDIKTDRWL